MYVQVHEDFHDCLLILIWPHTPSIVRSLFHTKLLSYPWPILTVTDCVPHADDIFHADSYIHPAYNYN